MMTPFVIKLVRGSDWSDSKFSDRIGHTLFKELLSSYKTGFVDGLK